MELCSHRRVLGWEPSAKPWQEPSHSLQQGDASRGATQTVSVLNPS